MLNAKRGDDMRWKSPRSNRLPLEPWETRKLWSSIGGISMEGVRHHDEFRPGSPLADCI